MGTDKFYQVKGQFYDDEPEESKAAAKVAMKAADVKVAKKLAADAEVGKEEEETNFLKLVAENKKLKAGLAAAESGSPLAHTIYDLETKQKNLVKNTAPARVLMEKLKDDYECVHYMGALCDHWKSLMPLDRAQNNEHVAFMKYFKKERHLYGLPEVVPASPGSKNVSRAITPAIDEEAVAGAK